MVKRKRRAKAGHRAELEVGEMRLWGILDQKRWEAGHLFQHRRRIVKGTREEQIIEPALAVRIGNGQQGRLKTCQKDLVSCI